MGVTRQWELSTVEIIRNRSCPAMGVIDSRIYPKSELSGSGNHPIMGVIWQWELSGNGSYPAMGVIWQWELFGRGVINSRNYPKSELSGNGSH